MQIRSYQPEDTGEMLALMHQAVHTVNAVHYTPAQLNAWCPGLQYEDLAAREAAFLKNHTLVACENGRITGWADMHATGYLDHIFVLPSCLGRGIASALLARLQQTAAAGGLQSLNTHASITARPFFEKQGWRLVKANTVHLRGETFDNFLLEKRL